LVSPEDIFWGFYFFGFQGGDLAGFYRHLWMIHPTHKVGGIVQRERISFFISGRIARACNRWRQIGRKNTGGKKIETIGPVVVMKWRMIWVSRFLLFLRPAWGSTFERDQNKITRCNSLRSRDFSFLKNFVQILYVRSFPFVF
jgi:hypothetical protein